MLSRPTHSTRILLAFLLALGAAACASSSGGSTGTGSNPNVIESEELRELGRLSAYQAVQRLQPQWLRVRGVDSFYSDNGVVVYVDTQLVGGVDELRRINTANVESMRKLSSREATTRFGTGHPSGAIMVTTRRR